MDEIVSPNSRTMVAAYSRARASFVKGIVLCIVVSIVCVVSI